MNVNGEPCAPRGARTVREGVGIPGLPHDLDIEVSRLQLLKGSYLSQKYELEDSVLTRLPREIRQQTERIEGYLADIETLKENAPAGDAFPAMTLNGQIYADKKEAGAALIEACKRMRSPDPVDVGSYRGFAMILEFDTFSHEYRLALQGRISHKVTLGNDVFGNVQRIDNTLANMEENMQNCIKLRETAEKQMETAKAEAEKPFIHEKELRTKMARLTELNTLLNLDKRENERADDEPLPKPENEKEYEIAR